MILDEKSKIEKAKWLRKKILHMTNRAGAGHVAPSFSCSDILVALHYSGIIRLKPEDPHWDERDRFILSKGQAAVALYAVLSDLGFFPEEELDLFTQPGSYLGGHTEDNIPGVEAFTGSLGHGLSIGAGLSWGFNMDKKDSRVYVLLGDGECHEGSVWEAAMFIGHHKFTNIMAIVDNNGLSATNHLEEYLSIESLEEKWRAFGWDVAVCNGHSFTELTHEMEGFRDGKHSKPFVLIAKTTKGKGVSFMENQPIWHYRIPVGEELERANKELE